MIQAMKKRIIVILTLLLINLSSMFGQIIYTEEDAGHSARQTTSGNDLGVMVPMQDSDLDQWKYSPLGSGLILLAGMGGLYMLAKRKKE